MPVCHWAYLGRVEFEAGTRLQEALRDQREAEAIPDTVVLLEHPPVITLGRRTDDHMLSF